MSGQRNPCCRIPEQRNGYADQFARQHSAELLIIGICVSFGRNLWISTSTEELKWAWISTMIHTVNLGLVKESIVILYLRLWLWDNGNFMLRFVAWAIPLYTIGIVIVIAIIVSGRAPVKANVFVVVHTVLQVIINIILACLPIKTIWKLAIPLKGKIRITLLLLLGFLTVIPTIFGGTYRLAAFAGIESALNRARGELAAKAKAWKGRGDTDDSKRDCNGLD
ncbi:hypothetical protein O988_03328 [Pseudogymnoascus sp. VKM F-3808]|nr:hypothetical protein O988_03328 [Pseudogymnoascus sp. VKM F-3808]